MKGIGKFQFVSELTILPNPEISKLRWSLHIEKYWNYQSLNIIPYVGKLTLVYCILLILPLTVFEEQCLAQRFRKLSKKVKFQQWWLVIFNFLCLYHVFPMELETRLYYLPITIMTDTLPAQMRCSRTETSKFDNFSRFQNFINNNSPPTSVIMTHWVQKSICDSPP